MPMLQKLLIVEKYSNSARDATRLFESVRTNSWLRPPCLAPLLDTHLTVGMCCLQVPLWEAATEMICQREGVLRIYRRTPPEREKATADQVPADPTEGAGAAIEGAAGQQGESDPSVAPAGDEVKVNGGSTVEDSGAIEGEGIRPEETNREVAADADAQWDAEEVKVTVAEMETEYYSEEVLSFLKANDLYGEHEEAKASGECKPPRQWVSGGL